MVSLDYSQPAPALAAQLIGWQLIVDQHNTEVGGTIIETEAYTQDDRASHSYGGPRVRNHAMFQDPGTIYIYRIYGLHHCLNIVCGNHDGQAVLLRAIWPESGVEAMQQRRRQPYPKHLTDGPAKLFEALGCDPAWNGQPVRHLPIHLLAPRQPLPVQQTPRVGITKNADVPWRFYVPPNFFRDSS